MKYLAILSNRKHSFLADQPSPSLPVHPQRVYTSWLLSLVGN